MRYSPGGGVFHLEFQRRWRPLVFAAAVLGLISIVGRILTAHSGSLAWTRVTSCHGTSGALPEKRDNRHGCQVALRIAWRA
jgi:hypothetical protein